MLRPAVAVLALMLAALPQAALAWSERPAPTGNDGGSRFSDPDERVSAMTGRSEDGSPRQGQNLNGQRDGSGWSFSMGPGPSERTPFTSMFNTGRPDRRW